MCEDGNASDVAVVGPSARARKKDHNLVTTYVQLFQWTYIRIFRSACAYDTCAFPVFV